MRAERPAVSARYDDHGATYLQKKETKKEKKKKQQQHPSYLATSFYLVAYFEATTVIVEDTAPIGLGFHIYNP